MSAKLTNTNKYLSYWRKSLADAIKQTPTDSIIQESLEITVGKDMLPDVINTGATMTLWQESQKQTDATVNLIPVTIIVKMMKKKESHGVQDGNERIYIPTIIATGLIDREGKLSKVQDSNHPFIPREFLSPNQNDIEVATLDDADEFYSANENPQDWEQVKEYCQKLYDKIVAPKEQDFEDAYIQANSRIYNGEPSPSAHHILHLYHWLIKHNKTYPVIDALLTSRQNTVVTQKESFDANHYGQMSGAYGLSPTQRVALREFFAGTDAVMAINGAPGTGKTTLIQSIAANLWVKAALSNGDCPLIVVSSTNNQAVENVIDSFAKVETRKDIADTQLVRRWIPHVSSFGLSMPSGPAAKNARDRGKKFQTYIEHPRSNSQAQHYLSDVLNEEGWEKATKEFLSIHYLLKKPKKDVDAIDYVHELYQAKSVYHAWLVAEHAKQTNLIANVEYLLATTGLSVVSVTQTENWLLQNREKLRSITEDSQKLKGTEKNIEDLLIAWEKHRADEPVVTMILAYVGLNGKRKANDRYFLMLQAQKYGFNELNEVTSEDAFRKTVADKKAHIANRLKALDIAFTELSGVIEHVSEVIAIVGKQFAGDMTIAEINAWLDCNTRHDAFLYASHYWEARFLIEMHKVVTKTETETRSPASLERHFRRLAMITPCFMTSLYMLPKWFTGYQVEELAMLGAIDLLIIDEAGQVASELGGASMALAKRTLVVGDTKQIDPVWNVSLRIDGANLAGEGLDNDFEKESVASASASEGSLMRMAKHASSKASFEDEGGLFLLEHRRCLKAIITYCNELVYKNRLVPLTNETGRPKLGLPTMGYANIMGEDAKAGGSRHNVIEATAIAEWVKSRSAEIKAAYAGELKDIIGIITPFAAQKTAIISALKKVGLGAEKITVGTVHALQGAERELIIFSPTYSTLPGRMFFDAGPNMMNVAVSRAKDHFLVFGNMELFAGPKGLPSGLLGASYLFGDPANEITDVRPSVGLNINSALITTTAQHRACLAEVLSNAVTEVFIVSPYITKDALAADDIANLVKVAVAKGVKVTIVVDENFASNNGKKTAEVTQCLAELRQAGAEVVVITPGTAESGGKRARLHTKVLWADDKVYVTGSFNWLSSSREQNQKLEISAVIRDGETSPKYIAISKERINELVQTSQG